MIPEPDQAILKKLAESSDMAPRVSEGVFDALQPPELDTMALRMVKESPRWTIIVTPTEDRSEDWWIYAMMIYFRDGLTKVRLRDGRLALCTWAAK